MDKENLSVHGRIEGLDDFTFIGMDDMSQGLSRRYPFTGLDQRLEDTRF